MNISANSLFHFTREFDNLVSILNSQFKPRCCKEKLLVYSMTKYNWAIPMVCFCDIPLSNISQHTQMYGNYAIGLKKEWAMKHKISPLLYIHKNSIIKITTDNYFDWIVKAIKSPDFNERNKKEKLENIFSMLSVMKPYRGFQINKITGKKKRIRFYDEREWRYVPNVDLIDYQNMLKYDDEKIMERLNSKYENRGLSFQPEDINFIIVNKEDEIIELMNKLTLLKKTYPSESVELLKTRIISMKRISEDF